VSAQRRKPQKAKGRKRPRAWHHGRKEDKKFKRAIELMRQGA